MKLTALIHATLLCASVLLASCGGGGSGDSGAPVTPQNEPPPLAQNTCVFDQSTFDNCKVAP